MNWGQRTPSSRWIGLITALSVAVLLIQPTIAGADTLYWDYDGLRGPARNGASQAFVVAGQGEETPTPTPTLTPTITPTPGATGTPQILAATGPNDDVPTEDRCWGDETIFFAPLKPYANTDVVIEVSSQKRHNVAGVRLLGPVRAGQVTERRGLHGWAYSWSVPLAIDGWYDWSFYVDSVRRCLTAGFVALPAFGSTMTPTPTETPGTPTAVPTGTPTMTSTPIPAPAITGFQPSSAQSDSVGCDEALVMTGSNFGSSQGSVGGVVIFGNKLATILSWSNSTIAFYVPTGLSRMGPHNVVVRNDGGSSSSTYTLRQSATPSPTSGALTPTPTPAAANC